MAEQRLIDANWLKEEIFKLPYNEECLTQTSLDVLALIDKAPTVKPKTIKTTESYRDEKYIFNGECNLDELYDTREKYIFNGECDHSEHKDYPYESMGS